MAKKKQVTKFKTKTKQGKRYMICRNSITDKNYWGWQILSKHPRCNEWSEVGEGATAVLCYKCVNLTVGPPDIKGGYKSTGRLRGWQFMKEFVDKDGNVFHKGKEIKKLKGTLSPTKVVSKPKKKVKRRSQEQILLDRHNEKKQALKKAIKKQKDFLNHQVGK